MKIKLISLFILMSSITCYSQLDVIDKIAGTLLPTVFSGIKDIKENGSKKEKTEKAENLQSQIESTTSSVVLKIDEDIANLTAIHGLFSLTSKITDELGTLKGLTGEEFLKHVILANQQFLFVHTGIRIDDALSELERINKNLQGYSGVAADPNLSSRIDRSVADLQSRLNKLLRRVRRSTPLSTTTLLKPARDYIKNVNTNDTRRDIDEMHNSVNDINVEMSSWIKSNINSLKQTKEKLKSSLE